MLWMSIGANCDAKQMPLPMKTAGVRYPGISTAQPQALVAKQELLTAIWDRRFVSNSTLSSRLSAVRHAIADSGGLQRFIRTIPRKGYRFVGQVWTGDLANLPAAGAEADRNAWRGQLSVPDTRPVVTVLPFNDVSRAPDHHDLGKTISDAMADALSRFRHFSIVARNPFGGSRDADHHTDYVIEGTVNRDNGRVRIAARLTDADTGRIIWTERVDCASDDAFSLQDRIIRTFVGAFASRLESAELARLRRAPTEPEFLCSDFARYGQPLPLEQDRHR